MKDSIELLSESEDDCQIYANESRLKDFTRGVELARQELLRWRSPHSEPPPHWKPVLIKLQKPNQIYIGRQSDAQILWQSKVEAQGYRYEVVRSLEEFKELIKEYLEL